MEYSTEATQRTPLRIYWRQYEIAFVTFAGFFLLLRFIFERVPDAQHLLSENGYEDAGWSLIFGHFFEHYFLPEMGPFIVAYMLYLFVNLYIIPILFLRKRYTYLAILISTGIWLLMLLIFALTYYKSDFYRMLRYSANIRYLRTGLYTATFIFAGYVVYAYFREITIREIGKKKNQPLPTVLCNNITAAGFLYLGAAVLSYAFGFLQNKAFAVFFFFFLLPAILTCFINVYRLFPQRQKKGKAFKKNGWWLIIAPTIFSILFGTVAVGDTDPEVVPALWLFLLLVATPVSWFIYMQQREKLNVLLNLQLNLDNTAANLQFLRSQINPHFLFNALNTIYGTALQENAERTAEAVQKLGDMMRFMLEDNQQERIPLDKEITYLTNYINLQKLRTQVSPDIEISFSNKAQACNYHIAPMLLIPFVENAFKHGISLKEISWIRINISCDTKNIYFDVYNSVHEKQVTDPEKNRSGIGLENVKQRLSLIYPNKHELHIRATSGEYFVHLTLQP